MKIQALSYEPVPKLQCTCFSVTALLCLNDCLSSCLHWKLVSGNLNVPRVK